MIALFYLLNLIIKVFSIDQLRWSFELINHGARSPHFGLDSNLNDFMNHTWIGQNELTGVGLRQSFLVGYRDRLRYIEDNELISGEYDPRDILIYASENNKTLMSANALLHGLFLPGTGPQIDPSLVDRAVPPVDQSTYIDEKQELDQDNCTALPGRMNLVPVHIFFSHEYFTQYENSKKCKGLKSYEEKNRNRNEVKTFLEDVSQKYGEQLINIFKDKNSDLLKDYEFAYYFFDTVISLYFDGADEFDELVNILKTDEKTLLDNCYKFLFMNTVGNGINNDREFVDYLVSPLFSKLLTYIDYRIEKDLKGELNYKGYDLPKYFILSGVSNSCGAFMSFMNKYFNTPIKYANFSTNLHIDLFLENSEKGNISASDYRIEYYYNDDFLLSIKYEDFKNKIKKKLLNKEQINEFCQGEEDDDDDDKLFYIIGAIIGSLIVIICLIIIIVIILKKRRKNKEGDATDETKGDKEKLLRDTNRTSVDTENNGNVE